MVIDGFEFEQISNEVVFIEIGDEGDLAEVAEEVVYAFIADILGELEGHD